MNIKRERIKLLMYNSGVLLITQTILVLMMKSVISSGRLDGQIYFFGYLPVVFNAIVVYKRSKYRKIRITKSDEYLEKMNDFLNSGYLTSLENQDEYNLKTTYSVSKVKIRMVEGENYYEIECPKYLNKVIKNYGIRDFSFI